MLKGAVMRAVGAYFAHLTLVRTTENLLFLTKYARFLSWGFRQSARISKVCEIGLENIMLFRGIRG